MAAIGVVADNFLFYILSCAITRLYDYCINNGLQALDAGVQGEHKLSRGFDPVPTWSYHWIKHEGFRDVIEDFLLRETKEIDFYIDELNKHLPYKIKE